MKLVTPFLERQITKTTQFFLTRNLPTTCETFVKISILFCSRCTIEKLLFQLKNLCIVFHQGYSKHPNALCSRAFVSFLVYGNPDHQTLALVYEIVHQRSWKNTAPLAKVNYIITRYSRILIGSRLWSIRGQTHDWRHHHKGLPSAVLK